MIISPYSWAPWCVASSATPTRAGRSPADADNRRQKRVIKAKFIFIGAGGAALTLLQETGIPQAKEYAGFPVGGQFWSAKIRRW